MIGTECADCREMTDEPIEGMCPDCWQEWEDDWEDD